MMSEQDAWDQYAAAAMSGFLAAFAAHPNVDLPDPEHPAEYAAKCANAMLAERRKRLAIHDPTDPRSDAFAAAAICELLDSGKVGVVERGALRALARRLGGES